MNNKFGSGVRIFYSFVIFYIYFFVILDIFGLNPEDDGDITFLARTPFFIGPFLLAFIYIIFEGFSKNKILKNISFGFMIMYGLVLVVLCMLGGYYEGFLKSVTQITHVVIWGIVVFSPVMMYFLYKKIMYKKAFFFISAFSLIIIFCVIHPARNFIESVIYDDPCRTRDLIARQYAGPPEEYQSFYKGVICVAKMRSYDSETFKWVKNELVDVDTFKYLGKGYSIDAYNVFYKNKKIIADPRTFTVEPSWKSEKMANYVRGSGLYVRDKERVYYEGEILPVEDIDKFQIINLCHSYRCATDGVKIFKEGKVVDMSNKGNLISLNTCEYSKDDVNAYHSTHVLKLADVGSFGVYGDDLYCYAYDKTHVYYEGKIVPKANPAKFKRVKDGDRLSQCTDGENIFYEDKVLNIDMDSYEYLGKSTIKDRISVYYRDKKIEEADAETFEMVTIESLNMCAKDKNRKYFDGEIGDHSACGR